MERFWDAAAVAAWTHAPHEEVEAADCSAFTMTCSCSGALATVAEGHPLLTAWTLGIRLDWPLAWSCLMSIWQPHDTTTIERSAEERLSSVRPLEARSEITAGAHRRAWSTHQCSCDIVAAWTWVCMQSTGQLQVLDTAGQPHAGAHPSRT